MTNGIYETAKRNGRKYLVATLIGASALFSGCDNNSENKTPLPINEETKNVLAAKEEILVIERTKKFNECLTNATDKFNEAIKDGYFSAKEQREVYGLLSKARDEGLVTADLENALNQSGTKVEVEYSLERLVGDAIGIGAVVGFICVGSAAYDDYCARKQRKRREEENDKQK